LPEARSPLLNDRRRSLGTTGNHQKDAMIVIPSGLVLVIIALWLLKDSFLMKVIGVIGNLIVLGLVGLFFAAGIMGLFQHQSEKPSVKTEAQFVPPPQDESFEDWQVKQLRPGNVVWWTDKATYEQVPGTIISKDVNHTVIRWNVTQNPLQTYSTSDLVPWMKRGEFHF
jgi:hypothetical protein